VTPGGGGGGKVRGAHRDSSSSTLNVKGVLYTALGRNCKGGEVKQPPTLEGDTSRSQKLVRERDRGELEGTSMFEKAVRGCS